MSEGVREILIDAYNQAYNDGIDTVIDFLKKSLDDLNRDYNINAGNEPGLSHIQALINNLPLLKQKTIQQKS